MFSDLFYNRHGSLGLLFITRLPLARPLPWCSLLSFLYHSGLSSIWLAPLEWWDHTTLIRYEYNYQIHQLCLLSGLVACSIACPGLRVGVFVVLLTCSSRRVVYFRVWRVGPVDTVRVAVIPSMPRRGHFALHINLTLLEYYCSAY